MYGYISWSFFRIFVLFFIAGFLLLALGFSFLLFIFLDYLVLSLVLSENSSLPYRRHFLPYNPFSLIFPFLLPHLLHPVIILSLFYFPTSPSTEILLRPYISLGSPPTPRPRRPHEVLRGWSPSNIFITTPADPSCAICLVRVNSPLNYRQNKDEKDVFVTPWAVG